MKKLILAAIACTAPLYAVQAQQVTYTWTTTNNHGGLQPTTASFDVSLSAVQSGTITALDISNIQLAYPGLTLTDFVVSSGGLDNAAYVDPTTGAFIFHDKDQSLSVIGYQGGLFSDTFLSITLDNPYSPFGVLLNSVADQYNALNNGSADAGFPTAGYWTASFPTTSSPAPEPATWAMMILGFAAVGFAMRARKSVRNSRGAAGAEDLRAAELAH